MVEGRSAEGSNPKDVRRGLTVEQVLLAKAYLIDAMQSEISSLARERSTSLHARQRTIAAAVAYFWRFTSCTAFATTSPSPSPSPASLASKVEENPIHDHGKLLGLAARLGARVYGDSSFALREDALPPSELRVMEELGFNLRPFDPYSSLRSIFAETSDTSTDKMFTMAWGLLNDSPVDAAVCDILGDGGGDGGGGIAAELVDANASSLRGLENEGTDPDAVALAASEMLRYRETFAESGVRDEEGERGRGFEGAAPKDARGSGRGGGADLRSDSTRGGSTVTLLGCTAVGHERIRG